MAADAIPLLRATPAELDKAERSELINFYAHCATMGNEWLYRQIIDNNRIDILAISVLGYEVKPFHLRMLAWQFQYPDNLQLVFRGAGKSTLCTVAKVIHLLCKDRNLRILLASKTIGNAKAFLREIKAHLEGNAKLTAIFGAFYDPRKVSKWDTEEIEVLGRTKHTKEASVACIGVEGTLVSKHIDVIISDDLIDDKNSATKHMRDGTKNWYYQTLDPCLEPPHPDVMHRGEHHRLGTRYHPDDLYGHLEDNELKESTLTIPALDVDGRSPWPEKYPPTWFKRKRKKAGMIIFNAQYQCDTEAMKGEIFQWDHCQMIEDDDIPSGLRIFQGIDLAISEQEKNDLFADVTIGFDKVDNCYVLDYFEGHLRFGAQTSNIVRLYNQHDPIRAGIETNAYQAAQYQTLKDGDRDIRLTPLHTDKDKITRAWKLSPRFEDGRMFFRKGGNMGPLLDQLVLFPNYRYKDGFDALDLAIRASKMRKRKRSRRSEPGLI